jgi:hypothetical protein
VQWVCIQHFFRKENLLRAVVQYHTVLVDWLKFKFHSSVRSMSKITFRWSIYNIAKKLKYCQMVVSCREGDISSSTLKWANMIGIRPLLSYVISKQHMAMNSIHWHRCINRVFLNELGSQHVKSDIQKVIYDIVKKLKYCQMVVSCRKKWDMSFSALNWANMFGMRTWSWPFIKLCRWDDRSAITWVYLYWFLYIQ